MAIVDKALAKTISKASENNEYYSGAIENSERMAIEPSYDDMLYAQCVMNESNDAEVEMGASKDSKSCIQRWDNGGEVTFTVNEDTGNLEGTHSIVEFTKNGNTIPDRILHQWDFHVHPVNSNYKSFGKSKPSPGDLRSDMNNRKWSYKGTAFILGGKDGTVSFYFNDKTICTVLLDILLDKLKELENKDSRN